MKKDSKTSEPEEEIHRRPRLRAEREASPFIKTTTWQRVQAACDAALADHLLVVIAGPRGVGKTRCLREYARREMASPPIYIDCRPQMRAGDLIRELARRLDLAVEQTVPRLEGQVIAELKRMAQPLFIDQADYLNERGLTTLSHLWDQGQVAVVLAGTPNLYERIKAIEMVESRVATYCLLAEMSDAEIKSLLKQVAGKRLSEAELNEIRQLTGGTHGPVQLLLRIIERVVALKAAEKGAH